jgi:hypothetical protein
LLALPSVLLRSSVAMCSLMVCVSALGACKSDSTSPPLADGGIPEGGRMSSVADATGETRALIDAGLDAGGRIANVGEAGAADSSRQNDDTATGTQTDPPDVANVCVAGEPQTPAIVPGHPETLPALPGQQPGDVKSPVGAPVTVLERRFLTDAIGMESNFGCALDPWANVICAWAGLVKKSDSEFRPVYSKYDYDLHGLLVGTFNPIAVDSAGCAFVGGSIAGKAAVLKLRSDGSFAWIAPAGIDGVANAIAVGPDGSVYAAVVPPTSGSTAAANGTLVHFSSGGLLVSSIETTVVGTSKPLNMHVDCSGNVTVLSSYNIARFDADLKLLWSICGARCASNPSVYNPVYRMGLPPDGSGLFTIEMAGLVRRHALTGEILWTRPFGVQQTTLDPIKDQPASWKGTLESVTAMAVASDSIYLAGQYVNEYKGWVTGASKTGFVARYDLSGEQLWFRQFRVNANASDTQLEDRLWSWLLLNAGSRGVLVGGHGFSASNPIAFFLDSSGTGP